MAFLNKVDLQKVGFKSVGKNVKVSDKASIHNPSNISIGDNTRIDDFCILSSGKGGIKIGSHVHISCYVSLIGSGKIMIENFVALSTRVAIFSSDDDYSGKYMVNPTLPKKLTNFTNKPVCIKKHVIVGTGAVILPGVTVASGAAVGALSLVKENLEPFWLYAGVPAKKIRKREKKLLTLEKKLI